MTNDKLPVPEGTVLQDKYQVGRVLGRGGMGVVMAARHLLLDTDVALKFLFTAEPEVVARFSREARAAARIQSEHVARVLDVGALPDGAPFIVMEYLAGEDLSQTLARGPLPPAEAVDYILQACEAIAEAHALGIVHRDLKPANLFLARRAHGGSVVKVLDFGISRGGARGMPTLTGTALLGSPQYMSPEQWTASRAVDARSDLWSLGVVLYEMLAGRRPFDGESLPAIYMSIANDAPPAFPPGAIPAALEAAVLRCLEKDANRRFPDVASLAAAIGGLGSAASRPLLDRIAQMASLERTALADTADGGLRTPPGDEPSGRPGSVVGPAGKAIPAASPEQEVAAMLAAMKVDIGGTAVLSPAGVPELGASTAAARDARARLPGPASSTGTARGLGARRSQETPEPASRFPYKVGSLALGVAGAVALVAVVIARVSGGHDPGSHASVEKAPSPEPVAAPARAPTPSPTPSPSAGTTPDVVPPPVAPAPPTAAPAVPAPTGEVPGGDRHAVAVPGVAVPGGEVSAPVSPEHPSRGPRARAAESTEVTPPHARERTKLGNNRPAGPAAGAKPGPHWSAVCSRFIARQSLGETLSQEDLALYMRECRR